jgi:hypothetical protein
LPVARNLSTFNFNRLPKGFLLALSMILVFETGNIFLDDYFYTPPFDGFRMKIKNELSQKEGNNFDIVILGDCYSHIGIIPAIIEEETGLSSFNFGTYAEPTILSSYCVFRNYLKTCAQSPRWVVMGFLPIDSCALTKDKIKKHSISFLYDFRKGNMTVLAREFGMGQAIRFLLPSLKHQNFFLYLIQHPLFFREQTKARIDKFIEQFYKDKGYHPFNADMVYTKEAEDPGSYPQFTVSEFFNKYLTAILELARENNVKIVYIMPENTPDWRRLDEKYGFARDHEDFIYSLKEKFPDTIASILETHDILNKKDMFIGKNHLNKKGARLLSKFLSDKLGELM